MSHTPFGYRIENGKAVIDIEVAEQIKTLFHSYLSGDSLATAAEKAGIKSFHASIGKMLRNAGLAIAVCGDTDAAPAYWVQDCSAATENILIAAAAIGLGAVWLGCHPREERVSAVRDILGIPEQFGILNLLSIGHPGERKEPRTQYDEGRIHRDRW